MPSSDPLLTVRGLGVDFGGIRALDEVGFDVAPGAIVGLIGPNGAGKTTLFNCLSRIQKPSRGEILLDGRSIRSLAGHGMVEAGIGRTFQNLALFEGQTVLANVMIGGHNTVAGSLIGDVLKVPAARRRDEELRERAFAILDRLGLRGIADVLVRALPLGTRKRIELARALCGRPKLLALDEPAGGLNRAEVAELGDLIRDLRAEFGVTILLVEHHMGLVMSICDRVVVLDFGRKIAEGTPAEISRDPAVVGAYLGAEYAA